MNAGSEPPGEAPPERSWSSGSSDREEAECHGRRLDTWMAKRQGATKGGAEEAAKNQGRKPNGGGAVGEC